MGSDNNRTFYIGLYKMLNLKDYQVKKSALLLKIIKDLSDLANNNTNRQEKVL
jgi:hypothetical protein